MLGEGEGVREGVVPLRGEGDVVRGGGGGHCGLEGMRGGEEVRREEAMKCWTELKRTGEVEVEVDGVARLPDCMRRGSRWARRPAFSASPVQRIDGQHATATQHLIRLKASLATCQHALTSLTVSASVQPPASSKSASSPTLQCPTVQLDKGDSREVGRDVVDCQSNRLGRK